MLAVRGNRLGGPFPTQYKCQLVYTAIPSLTLSSGSGTYLFSTNGLYDPDITGTGKQPLYFDQLTPIYNHYTVTSSFIEIQPLFNDTAHSLVMALYIDDDTTTAPTISDAMMRPGAKCQAINTFGAAIPQLTLGWSASRNFGPVFSSNPAFRGNASANPDEQMYFTFVVRDMNLVSTELNFRVKITYNVTWTEFKTVAES